jgi:hypothetical protein
MSESWMRSFAERGAASNDRLQPSNTYQPPVVKGKDLLSPVVESKRRATASDKRRITAVPFSAAFVSSAGSHPEVGMNPNTY